MKIRALESNHYIEIGEVLDAIRVNDDEVVGLHRPTDTIWRFYKDKSPRFEIIDYPNQDIIDLANKQDHDFASIAGIHSIPKVYGNKYTLSELKELKELFK